MNGVTLKAEQKETIQKIVDGEDCFVNLPTGFGICVIIYFCLHLVAHFMKCYLKYISSMYKRELTNYK